MNIHSQSFAAIDKETRTRLRTHEPCLLFAVTCIENHMTFDIPIHCGSAAVANAGKRMHKFRRFSSISFVELGTITEQRNGPRTLLYFIFPMYGGDWRFCFLFSPLNETDFLSQNFISLWSFPSLRWFAYIDWLLPAGVNFNCWIFNFRLERRNHQPYHLNLRRIWRWNSGLFLGRHIATSLKHDERNKIMWFETRSTSNARAACATGILQKWEREEAFMANWSR